MKTHMNKLTKNNSLLLIISIILILIIMRVFNIRTIPCLFYTITHKYCPGCGMTRMILSLLHMRFYQAFRYNMLGFAFMPFVLVYLIYSLILWIEHKENNLLNKIPNNVWYSLIVITVLFGVLRNISYFSFLAPTVISK